MDLVEQHFDEFSQIIVVDFHVLYMSELQLKLKDGDVLLLGNVFLELVGENSRQHGFLIGRHPQRHNELVGIVVVVTLSRSFSRFKLLELRHAGIVLAQKLEHVLLLLLRGRQLGKAARQFIELFHFVLHCQKNFLELRSR